MKSTRCRASAALRRVATSLALAVVLAPAFACSDTSTTTTPGASSDEWSVQALGPEAPVQLRSGRRSPEPFRFRVVDGAGTPISGVRVPIRVEPAQAGTLSQRLALSDGEGVVESYLLDPTPGSGEVVAGIDAPARIAFDVSRAPGSVTFEPGSGLVGLPGLSHPDSVLRIRVLDTEGDPMPDRLVFFSSAGLLSAYADTTDAGGYAETRLRRSPLVAGDGTVFAFLANESGLLAQTPRPTVAPAQRVVLVSVDGLRTDAVSAPDLPAFQALARDGASGILTTVSPSLTVPAHLSLLSGVPPDEHQVYSEDLEFTPEMNALDPAFRISVQAGGDTRAFMAADGPLSRFEEILECRLAFGFEELSIVSGGAGAIVDAALGAVADTSLSAVFLHLPDPDVAGHADGFDGAAYAAAVREVDAALGRVVAALPEGTLLIVTSDHGGGGAYGRFQHGSDDPIDARVPIFMLGSGVRPGAQIEAGRTILDVAPTLVWSTGVAAPQGYRGAPLLSGFRNP